MLKSQGARCIWLLCLLRLQASHVFITSLKTVLFANVISSYYNKLNALIYKLRTTYLYCMNLEMSYKTHIDINIHCIYGNFVSVLLPNTIIFHRMTG